MLRPSRAARSLLLAATLLAPACADDPASPEPPGTEPPAGDVLGVWRSSDVGGGSYVEITDTTLVFHDRIAQANCYFREEWRITSDAGDVVEARSALTGAAGEFELRRSGDHLTVRHAGVRDVYQPAEDAVASLDACGVAAPASLGGEWVHVGGETKEYVSLIGSEMRRYRSGGDCFDLDVFDILDARPEKPGFVLVLRDRASGGVLYALAAGGGGAFFLGGTIQYVASDVATSELATCPPGGGGAAASIDCASLPPLPLGQVLNGSFAPADPTYHGRPYRLFRLDFDSETDVRVSLSLSYGRPRLYVYDAGGANVLIGREEVALLGTSAIVQASLGPGCHRVEATSSEDATYLSWHLRADVY